MPISCRLLSYGLMLIALAKLFFYWRLIGTHIGNPKWIDSLSSRTYCQHQYPLYIHSLIVFINTFLPINIGRNVFPAICFSWILMLLCYKLPTLLCVVTLHGCEQLLRHFRGDETVLCCSCCHVLARCSLISILCRFVFTGNCLAVIQSHLYVLFVCRCGPIPTYGTSDPLASIWQHLKLWWLSGG